MTTEIIPLGTSSATPTRYRSLSATALSRAGRILLFDCGEGTQFRLMDADLNRMRIDAVFISHLHGDHFFGLPGLLTSLSLHHRSEALTIVGPEGLGGILEMIPGLGHHELSFPLHFVEFGAELGKDVVFETNEVKVTARPLEHRITAAGFRFEEKPRAGRLDVDRARGLGIIDPTDFGRLKRGLPVQAGSGQVVRSEDVVGPNRPGARFAYVFDSRPTQHAIELARDVDILFHEATFASDEMDRAKSTGHSTAREAARVALEAGARRLLLGHFSARYRDVDPLVNEARSVFKNTEEAIELKRYVLGGESAEPASHAHPSSDDE
jgi:ribonuclease Z